MAVKEKAARSFERGSEEFSRALAFSDAVFAIAMTLLVVGIEVPDLSDTHDVGDLAAALNDQAAPIISFFVSFAVIGRYWIAHHQFFSLLARVDRGLIGINLIYLAFIAFMPFPTAILGNYFENPLSIAIYATAVIIVSGLEVVQFRHAYEHGLLRRRMPEPVYRWGVLSSFSPLVFFAASVPLAFLNTTIAVLAWVGVVPMGTLLGRRKPEGAEELLG